MTREELLHRAADPKQYDSPDLDWPREGRQASPAMRFFRSRLRHQLGDLSGKSVVDIGCGTGHLYVLFEMLGARRAVGLEPSARNAAAARKEFPRLIVIETSLQGADLACEFDLAVAVMSFEHQPDLLEAFLRVARMLRPGGRFLLVVGDKEFHLTPRFDLSLEVHENPDGSAAVATGYPYGTLCDVVRPVLHYERAAQAAGFTVRSMIPLLPTHELIDTDTRWREFEARPVGHLLVMDRGENEPGCAEGGCHDSKAQVGPIPSLLAKAGSQDRKAAEPRDLPDARGGAEA